MSVPDRRPALFLEKERIDAFWHLAFILAFAVIFACMVFKANYVGTHHDESYTCFKFSKDIHTARHSYSSTNNHVLNSILMCFARKMFGDYVHYVRIFPLLSALLFFVSIAYIIKKVIKSPALQTASLILIFTLSVHFEYLYIARGYTFGLSAMAFYVAAVFFLMSRPAAFKRWWIVAAGLSFINFYSLGAMLSAALCMFSLNAVFILFYSAAVYKDPRSRIVSIILHGCLIAAISGLLLYLFYRPILSDILNIEQNKYIKDIAAGWAGWRSFVPFIRELLIDTVFNRGDAGAFWWFVFFAAALAGLAAVCARAVRAIRFGNRAAFIDSERFGLFLLLFFAAYFGALFVYSVILKKSPGLMRNQLFLLPVFLLVCLWCIDCLHRRFSGRFWLIVQIMLIGAVLGTGLHRTPSLIAISSGCGMARPTLERLNALDPQTTWKICFSQKMRETAMNFQYYTQFPRDRFAVTGPQDCNVFICKPDEYPNGAPCLDYDYYIKYDDCIVALVKPLDMEKVIFEAKPKKKP